MVCIKQRPSRLSPFVFLIAVAIISPIKTDFCHGGPKQYFENHNPVWKEEPRFVAKHQFGKLYEIGTSSTKISMIHVYGNHYQMGFAQGTLLKQKLNSFLPQLQAYIEQQAAEGLPKWIPKFLVHKGVNFAIKTALDLTYQMTRAWTNKKYYEEMRGIAEASGVSYKDLRRIHMVGELTKGSCSMIGAWGNATSNGQTVQLRSLDWDINGPFKNYPLVVVYHPSKGNGNKWLNIGFVGWVGVLSGVNQHKMGVSEIGVFFSDETFGRESRFGNPFTFVLRDVLQWDRNIEESIHRMRTTKRTCNLILGVGDGNKGYFRGFQYSHSTLNVVNDSHPLPTNSTWHPAIPETVYWGMDWNCPAYHARLAEMLRRYSSNITAENIIRYIVPAINSGNLQTVVYDLTYEWVYFAYGQENDQGQKIDAYKRPYLALDLAKAFRQPL